MAKAKLNLKDFLLRRGEVLVMGLAALFLLILVGWGASKWTSGIDPAKESSELTRKAENVQREIREGKPNPDDLKQLDVPKGIWASSELKPAPVADFASDGRFFDSTALPNTKRENPYVLQIGEYQADLTRSAMLGYDIIYDENLEPLIAVRTTKTESKLDDAKIKKAMEDLKNAAKLGALNKNKLNQPKKPEPPKGGNPPMPMGGGPPMPMGGPGGSLGPPPGGGGSLGPAPGMGSPHGLQSSEYDQQAKRSETAIEYIALKEIDAAVRGGKAPALTVIPLRVITVHAVVPYKKQLDEIKRALRLPNPPSTAKPAEIAAADAEARRWGPWYDGYEVQRRITKPVPGRDPVVIQDWPEKPLDPKDTTGNYKFEETYIDKIDTRKIADHFDEGYIPYFLKPEMMLAMPLPQLAKELNVKYPDVKLKDILDNIEKLKRANQKEVSQSELAQKLSGSKPGRSIYGAKTGDTFEGLGGDTKKWGGLGPIPGMPGGMNPMPGPGSGPAPGGPGPGGLNTGTPKPPQGYNESTTATPQDVDNFLLRFVDSDVKPGYSYEYRIRLRMWNPNFGQDALVANPEYAKEGYKLLHSKWTQLTTQDEKGEKKPLVITVPAESFLFAHDVKTYRDQINAAYLFEGKDATAETKALNKLLQVRDDQAVVQVATWMEQVRTDGASNKREPVGAWVVAEMPVGRGEFVGRKQYIKLPLWSSETQQYVLRELTDKVIKGKFQPKGWMVDFSTKSVLVDFEGGKVKTKSNFSFDRSGNIVPSGRPAFEEDVGAELLIVRPDGKLVVRNSLADDADANRKEITGRWAEWVKEVEKRKTPGTTGMGGDPNPFDPPKKP